MQLKIATQHQRQVVDITDQVQKLVSAEASAVSIFVAHTTCAITTADLDPGAGEDLAAAVWEMIPKLDYSRHHDPSHMPAHIASSIIGPSVTVPAGNGRLVLGSWQRIVLVELDGPRERTVIVTTF